MKSITVLVEDFDGMYFERDYAVNNKNEGLFYWTNSCTWSQLKGHGQFRARTPREMMRKLRKELAWPSIKMVRGTADGWD